MIEISYVDELDGKRVSEAVEASGGTNLTIKVCGDARKVDRLQTELEEKGYIVGRTRDGESEYRLTLKGRAA